MAFNTRNLLINTTKACEFLLEDIDAESLYVWIEGPVVIKEHLVLAAPEEIDMSNVDFDIVYIVIRDWAGRYLNPEEKNENSIDYYVKKFMGLSHACIDRNDYAQSSSRLVKSHDIPNMRALSKLSGLPVRTLHNWFRTKPILFQALVEFASKTENIARSLNRTMEAS